MPMHKVVLLFYVTSFCTFRMVLLRRGEHCYVDGFVHEYGTQKIQEVDGNFREEYPRGRREGHRRPHHRRRGDREARRQIEVPRCI